jgi:1-acyl-sn-glycerol-3-phosphate acyltransferase
MFGVRSRLLAGRVDRARHHSGAPAGCTVAESGDTGRVVADTPHPSWFYLLVGGASYPILRLLYRERWTGLENVPAAGGCVLAANHCSNFDPWPLGIPLFPRRYLRFMGKSELFWFPLGAIIRSGGAFPVRRERRDTEAIATAVSLCREGHVVVMFPEGTRRSKGMRKKHEARWRSGAARIALEAEVPLVPAAISGTDRLARFAPLRVAYGPRVEMSDLSGEPIVDGARTATDRLRAAVEALEASLQ